MRRSQLMVEVQEKFRSLSRAVQRRVRGHAQFDHDSKFWQRCRIVLNLVRGHRPCDISRHLLCSVSTVTRVAHAFVADGLTGLEDGRMLNGTRKIHESEEEFLMQCATGSPQDYSWDRPTWTLELFALTLKKLKGVVVSLSTVSRTLAKLEIKSKIPRPFLLCPWKKRRKNKRLKEVRQLLAATPEDEEILYVDEVDIHLNPKIGRDWMPFGVQKMVLTPGKNKKHYLAGALNARTDELSYVESDHKDSYLFIDQLWTLVERDYPDASRIHLILDNYSIHCSKLTQLARDALSDRITLHFLPPYCPQHNRIERAWKDLHANVTRNHTCTSIEELMDRVSTYIEARNLKLETIPA
jgi:transposase